MRTVASTIVVAGFIIAAPISGQTSNPVSTELASAFAVVAKDLQAAAEQMPAEGYAFRPAEEVRNFGQIIAHVAGGHFLYCSQAAGQRLEPELSRRLNEVRPFSDVATAGTGRTFEKPELVALLGEAVAFCEKVYADATLSAGGGVRALIGNIAHDNEHYGNLVTYLRLKGIVPPSTERRTTR